MNNQTAIILGATGLVGSHIIQALQDEDAFTQVLALVRQPVQFDANKVQALVIDFEKLLAKGGSKYFEKLVSSKITEVSHNTVLFSALGTTIKRAGSIEGQRLVDVDMQYKVAQSCFQLGVRRLQLVSSSMAQAQAKSPYLKMKGELEDMLKEFNWEQLTIVRPSLLLGARDHFRLGEKFGAVLMPLLGFIPGLRKYRPIHASEVTARLIHEAKSWDANDVYKLNESQVQTFELSEVFL